MNNGEDNDVWASMARKAHGNFDGASKSFQAAIATQQYHAR